MTVICTLKDDISPLWCLQPVMGPPGDENIFFSSSSVNISINNFLIVITADSAPNHIGETNSIIVFGLSPRDIILPNATWVIYAFLPTNAIWSLKFNLAPIIAHQLYCGIYDNHLQLFRSFSTAVAECMCKQSLTSTRYNSQQSATSHTALMGILWNDLFIKPYKLQWV